MMFESADNRNTAIWRANSGKPILIEVLTGPETGRGIRVDTMPCRIGRGGRANVILADPDEPPAISREHLTVENVGLALVVRDHSVNGTRVGDRWLAHGETAEWPIGEAVQIGPTVRLRQIATGPVISNEIKEPPRVSVQCGKLRAYLTAPETLSAAWRRVELNRGAAGPDNVTIADFTADAQRRLTVLREQLARGRYEPLPPRLFAAPKRSGGVRKIAILTVTDRIVQQALHMACQPLLEPRFPACSYAYRPGFSAHHALRHVNRLLRQGNDWVAETDIAGFFDHVRHGILLNKLADVVPDAFILTLISRCLASVAEEPGIGIAQGAAMSPLLSNLYLAEFDAHMLAGGWNPVRYGDDLVFLNAARNRAQAALAEAEGFLRSRLNLELKPEKTGITPLSRGFSFLGYRFTKEGHRPAPQSVARLRQRLAESSPDQSAAIQRGWSNYFRAEATQLTDSSSRHDENIDRFLRLFAGREDTHARQGGGRFVPCSGPLTPESVRMHLDGKDVLAAYLTRVDGRVGSVVLDVDAPGRKSTERKAQEVFAFAHDIMRICRTFGIPAALEDSGLGRHVWIFFSEPISPDRARRLARLLSVQSGFPRTGVRLEILPRHSEWPGPELGDAVKLPFGVHPETGRRCHILDRAGEPILDFRRALDSIRVMPASQVEAVIAALGKSPLAAGQVATADQGTATQAKPNRNLVTQLIEGCSVVRALVDRAKTAGHLRHTHNLILLYTAGRLGQDGHAFVHRTLSHCRNYDAQICQGYLDRLDQHHPPLSCRRIREWLEEEGESSLCMCSRSRQTPMECIGDALAAPDTSTPKRMNKPGPSRPTLPSESDHELRAAWEEIAADLFDGETNGAGEPPASEEKP